MTWHDVPEVDPKKISGLGWVRVVLRGAPLVVLVLGGLIVLLLVRLIERPLFGLNRPLTPHITQLVCRNGLRILGIGYRVEGTPMKHAGAVVCNHASWLDIFALNACQRVYFVSKAEVSSWPLIGWLARATGTVFIRRDRREAAQQKELIEGRLLVGHKLLFFPEGTSSDGLRVLPFKSTLFAAFFSRKLAATALIQPATVTYHPPDGEAGFFYGWWGDMELGPHLLQTLGAARQGRIEVVLHDPLKESDFEDRKQLAQACEEIVRRGLRIEAKSGL